MFPLNAWFASRKALGQEVDRLREELRRTRDCLERSRLETEAVRREATATLSGKSNYLANLSHDLRTPINAVLGFSALASRLELAPKAYRYIKQISKAAESLRDMINDVLDLAKIEADRMLLDPIEFQLQEVLARVVNLTAFMAAEKGLEFVVTGLEATAGGRWGDPMRLGQVLTNLVANAIKFTPAGQVVIHVEEEPGRPEAVRFEVRDTGIGIDPSQRELVFQAFAQADRSTARRFGGTGLGLAIARNLVERMGGRLQLESEVGVGTRFSFTIDLPLRPGPAAARIRAGVRVLVAGPAGATRQALEANLAAQGARVQCAATAAAALAALAHRPAEAPFDLVFLDLRLPDQDGIETARRVRADPWLEDLPLVLLVGAAVDAEVEARAERAGIKVLLTLPPLPGPMAEAMIRAAKGPSLAVESTGRIGFGPPEVLRELAGARLLLVDDNPMNLELGTELLTSVGIEVVAVDSGGEALARMDQSRFDAILLDLEMPGLDGWACTARIRARPADGDTPIIALTAHAQAGFRNQCLAAGMDDYIPKPFDLPHLFRVLNRWLAVRHEPCPSAPPDRFHGLEPVLAIEAALDRMEGNADLLEKHLRKFHRDPARPEDAVRNCLDRGDLAAARDIVHPLRGLVGMLGLTRAFEAAADLETSLRNDDRAGAEAAQLRFADALREFRACMDKVFPGG
jgi:signal transduction histidine kinase/CheY-like chemotaxis protein/HPt (histidine-containing phosphotransfer) domain-containing protein